VSVNWTAKPATGSVGEYLKVATGSSPSTAKTGPHGMRNTTVPNTMDRCAGGMRCVARASFASKGTGPPRCHRGPQPYPSIPHFHVNECRARPTASPVISRQLDSLRIRGHRETKHKRMSGMGAGLGAIPTGTHQSPQGLERGLEHPDWRKIALFRAVMAFQWGGGFDCVEERNDQA